MKELLGFLKNNWLSLILVPWIVWITIVVLDTRETVQIALWQSSSIGNIESKVDDIESKVGRIEFTVDGIESTVDDVVSDVATIKKEVSPKYRSFDTLRSLVEEIKER